MKAEGFPVPASVAVIAVGSPPLTRIVETDRGSLASGQAEETVEGSLALAQVVEMQVGLLEST